MLKKESGTEAEAEAEIEADDAEVEVAPIGVQSGRGSDIACARRSFSMLAKRLPRIGRDTLSEEDRKRLKLILEQVTRLLK